MNRLDFVGFIVLKSDFHYRTAVRLLLPHNGLNRKLVCNYCDVSVYRRNPTLQIFELCPLSSNRIFFIRGSNGRIALAIR